MHRRAGDRQPVELLPSAGRDLGPCFRLTLAPAGFMRETLCWSKGLPRRRSMESTQARAVVVGLDRSRSGQAALDYAAKLAHEGHLRLRVVCAFEPSLASPHPTVGWTENIE